jgi:hypothetical protein
MKYRKLNAEVEAVQFEAKYDLVHQSWNHNGEEVAKLSDCNSSAICFKPNCSGFGDICFLRLVGCGGESGWDFVLHSGEWLVRVAGGFETFTASEFAAAYEAVEEPNFVARLKAEKADLDAKAGRLTEFMATAWFAALKPADQALLKLQLPAMAHYSALLEIRLDRLTAGGEGKVASSGSFPGKSGSSPDPASMAKSWVPT